MRQIKHSKFKNTAILFELLTRQITLEVLNGDKTQKARKIVREFFKPGTELNKELRLYQLLQNEKYNNESRAEKFVDTINEAHRNLDTKKISKQKYELVKQIKENFDMDKFLSSPIKNYKVMASIYKVFESKFQRDYDIKDVFDSKITLVENITSKKVNSNFRKDKLQKLVEEYQKQDKDVRLLTYKILIESFNKKYSVLGDNQKNLLREYINNVNNTSKFTEYYKQKSKETVSELSKLSNKIDDKVTKIKLKEVINVLKSQKINRTVTDNQVSSLMNVYELIGEIKSNLK
jgi:hypothetical protein